MKTSPEVRIFPGGFFHQSSHLNNSRAKREQRKSRDLKELLSERNPHDRNAQNNPDHKVPQRQLKSRNKEPYYIQKTRHRAAFIHNLFSERIQRNRRQLKTLKPDRNSHNRDAPQNACQPPADRAQKSAAYYPYHIP